MTPRAAAGVPPAPPVGEREALERGTHGDPHAILGAHPVGPDVVVRAFHPEAVTAECVVHGEALPMARQGEGGLFAVLLPGATLPLPYRVRFHFRDGNTWERDDPYRFPSHFGELDLHLINEGTHRRPWERLGASVRTIDGVEGTAFATWAPNARGISVVGDFCVWDARLLPMRRLDRSGVWELFVPAVRSGALYKFAVNGADGVVRLKADPYAAMAERSPGVASRVFRSEHAWGDGAWMEARRRRDVAREPLSACEVHLGSWARVPEEGNRPLTYREIAPRLADHARRLGFNAIELMPIAEHPFDPSWGYQVSGYYAPTSRYGTPDDFRFFVDTLHQAGLHVILDWVPGHFVKDDFALLRYDGTPLYEHEDPRRGEHPDWKTAIFNYGRNEVKSFLVGNALYWLEEFHVDGLRVDAVASMLYLDYSRAPGEWVPNAEGGREDREAVDLLRTVNAAIRELHPGCFTIAEESTAWPGVTAPVEWGGLGFTFKWNMGWMHDTLAYFATDPIFRPHHQDQITFAMLYEHTERFVNPLSHDEIVHGKRSLLRKMPGDPWQQFANLRVLLTYMLTRPGKKLLFMGTELAPPGEWRHDESLPWHLARDSEREGLAALLADLGRLYYRSPCLWRTDPDPWGFSWIDCNDRHHSVLSYQRRDGDAHVVVVLNLTPVPRPGYRVGVPSEATYRAVVNTDDPRYGGSGWRRLEGLPPEPIGWQGHARSIVLDLPPLSALVLEPEP